MLELMSTYYIWNLIYRIDILDLNVLIKIGVILWLFYGSWLKNTHKLENQLPKIGDILSTVFQPSRDWWWT
jgi:hypothetical protein